MSWQPPKPPFTSFKKTVFSKAGLVTDFVFQIGEYLPLRQVSQEVNIEDIATENFKEKLAYLKECLLKYRKLTGYGRGITAVQIGIPERFSVVYTPEELMVIINPTITKSSKTLLIYPEMCMSANPIIAPTTRPSWIEFNYYDEKGKLQHWDTKDETDMGRIMNRVFQHEIDHMEGIINIDITDPKTLILESDPDFYKNAKFEEVT